MSMKNTARREFLGIDTTLEVKTALQEIAKRLNKSVSFTAHSILAKAMRAEGFEDCNEGTSNAEYRKSR